MAFTGQLTGNLGRDPELRYLESGQTVATFSVAVRQPKRQGEAPPAFWVKVEAWNKTATWLADNVRKGDQVLVCGTVAQETFTRRDGTAGQAVVINNAQVEKMWEPRGQQQTQPAAAPAPTPAPAPASAPVAQAAQSLSRATGGVVSQHQDNIPF